jgi:hypothetical protein
VENERGLGVFGYKYCLCSLWHYGTQFFIIFHSLIQCILVAKICSVLQLTALFSSLRSACLVAKTRFLLPSSPPSLAHSGLHVLVAKTRSPFPQTVSVLHPSLPGTLVRSPLSSQMSILHSLFASPSTTAALWSPCFSCQNMLCPPTHRPL